MRFLVIGSGFQGRACAYDLLRGPASHLVTLCDESPTALRSARQFLGPSAGHRIQYKRLSAREIPAIRRAVKGFDAMISCVPYFLNLPLAKAAVAARVHFIDLGGDTSVVKKELALHAAAVKAGVCVLPDNGLGPGMISTLAVHAMSQLDRTDEVLLRDGGLPRAPAAPMNYLLTFSEHGLINEYVAPATALREGKIVQIDGLSEIETLDLPPPLGRCEAAHAAGGLSTLAETYAGKVRTMDNKLIRYPGHIAVINAMKAMGFFEEKAVDGAGRSFSPRAMSAALFRRHFHRPGEEDMVVIHNTVRGIKDGRPAEVVHDLIDFFDAHTGMTAMMRTTGFPASIVAQMAVSKLIPPGAYPVERAVPPELFIAELRKRGFNLKWSFRWRD